MGEIVYLIGEPSQPGRSPLANRVPLAVKPRTELGLKTWKKCLIYYVSYGRNAWKSTWVRRYKPNQFSASEKLSIEYVNENLKQGSTYTLKTIPAIVADFSVFRAVVAEINTTVPFLHARNEYFGKVLEPGTRWSDFAQQMNPSSQCWSPAQRKQNSIIVQSVTTPISEFVEFNGEINHPQKKITGLGDWVRRRDGALWWWAICDPDRPLLHNMELEAFRSLGATDERYV